MRIRVMSYNVHACVGVDRRLLPERIARVIASIGPDVVALQEVDRNRRRTGFCHQAQEIANHLEMDHHFHPSLEVDDGHYGNAILSRFRLQVRRAAPLARPYPMLRLEPRAAIWTELDVDGTPLQFVNTHLGLLPGERLLQVHDLVGPDWLSHPDCAGPLVLCGDFNAVPGSPAHRALCRHLGDCDQQLAVGRRLNTYTSYLPVTRLDHVFVSPHLKVVEVSVPRDSLTRIASDHLPLVVDLELTGAPASGQEPPPP